MTRRLPALVLASLAIAAPARAQTWRSLDASRQLRDSGAVSVRLDYAAGKLDLKPAAGSVLYRETVRYDADRAEPLAQFDSASRMLSLGVRLRGAHLGNGDDEHDAGAMHAELSSRVPMDLSLALGAVEADLQFGGLRLTDLALRCGAADVTARFDQPNGERLRTITLQVGAATVKLLGVANSGVSHVIADVGAGSLSIDLGGVLARDVDVSATVAAGGLTLTVSPDDGVFVDERTLFGSFDKSGFVKRADGWYSTNYDTAGRHVQVHLRAFLGGLTLTRGER